MAIRVAVDAMGGDNAPGALVRGAVQALSDEPDIELVFVGDEVLSAGNTGACAAVCQLKMKPLPCVTRPGIAVTIPAFHGPFVLCDVGANIHAKPRHLYADALIATLYAQRGV